MILFRVQTDHRKQPFITRFCNAVLHGTLAQAIDNTTIVRAGSDSKKILTNDALDLI
jgi:hypothetical protein